MAEIELFSREWCERIAEWRVRFLQQVAHLPILDDIRKAMQLPAVELVELTICGQMDSRKQDCANPEERKPVIFQEWRNRDSEDGGGQESSKIECGRFIKETAYIIGRAFGTAIEQNDTTMVIYVAAIRDDGTLFPPRFESLQQIDAENIAQYKVLERLAR